MLRSGIYPERFCLLVCACIWVWAWPVKASAEPFFADSYLITGSVECTDSVGDDSRHTGKRTCFFVAITKERALVGWSFDQDGNSGEYFRYVAKNLPGPVGVEFFSKTKASMLESQGRNLQGVLLQQDAAISTQAQRLDSIEMAAFSEYPFALFFSSSYLGAGTADVASLLEAAVKESHNDNPCGILAVRKDDRGSLLEIRFSQESNNRLSARLPGKTLADYESPLFAGGLTHTTYSSVFQPPLRHRPVAPWTTISTYECVGTNGHVCRTEYTSTVTKALFDQMDVDREIDAIIGLIPDGEQVQSIGPIEFVWEQQNVVRRVDSGAINVARSLTFSSNRTFLLRGLLATGCIALLILGVLIVRKSKSSV